MRLLERIISRKKNPSDIAIKVLAEVKYWNSGYNLQVNFGQLQSTVRVSKGQEIELWMFERLANGVVNTLGMDVVVNSKAPCYNTGWKCGYRPDERCCYFTIPFPADTSPNANLVVFDAEIREVKGGYQLTVSKNL